MDIPIFHDFFFVSCHILGVAHFSGWMGVISTQFQTFLLFSSVKASYVEKNKSLAKICHWPFKLK